MKGGWAGVKVTPASEVNQSGQGSLPQPAGGYGGRALHPLAEHPLGRVDNRSFSGMCLQEPTVCSACMFKYNTTVPRCILHEDEHACRKRSSRIAIGRSTMNARPFARPRRCTTRRRRATSLSRFPKLRAHSMRPSTAFLSPRRARGTASIALLLSGRTALEQAPRAGSFIMRPLLCQCQPE